MWKSHEFALSEESLEKIQSEDTDRRWRKVKVGSFAHAEVRIVEEEEEDD